MLLDPSVTYPSQHVVFDVDNHSSIHDGISIDTVYSKPPTEGLDLLAGIVGWAYFLAWTCAFYPQMINNCLRRSVVGLNFDFIALNFTGHITYAVFNSGLYWIPQLQDEYFSLHPGGIIPVQLNDVLFSIHAGGAVFIWIMQAVFYEREGQLVSLVCILLLLVIAAYVITLLTLTILGAMTWLTFIYYFSYVKLLTAVTKYSPQVYLHYKRKTTFGFSMGGVLLDMTGGAFSIIQMLLIAYNYSDWGSIIGDPTKLGLGLISITYSLIFVVQNYVLYKESAYEPIGPKEEQVTPGCFPGP